MLQGFQQQTRSWPEQPLDAAVAWLRKLPKKLRVADFGCGDAALAKAVKQKTVSLDLVAAAPNVLACNMSNTPLGIHMTIPPAQNVLMRLENLVLQSTHIRHPEQRFRRQQIHSPDHLSHHFMCSMLCSA